MSTNNSILITIAADNISVRINQTIITTITTLIIIITIITLIIITTITMITIYSLWYKDNTNR